MKEKENQQEQQPVEHKKGTRQKYKNAMDLLSRRERRNPARKKYRNDRSPVGGGLFQMGSPWDHSSAVFSPRRKKYKGWQRELFRKTGIKRTA